MAHGRRAKEAVLEEAVQHFRSDYISAAQKQGLPAFPLQYSASCSACSALRLPYCSSEAGREFI